MEESSTPGARPKAVYVLSEHARELIYGPDEVADIAALLDLYAPPQTRESVKENPSVLAEAEVLLSGWGAPVIDAAFLETAPRLRAFFYGAGATGGLVHPAAFARGVVVVSAADANAVPVAEYSVGAILLGLKQAFRYQREIREAGAYPRPKPPVAGAYGSLVGLVSLGAIGRLVVERLRAAAPDVRVLAYDPFLPPSAAASLGVALSPSLDDLFRRADVVSVHTPWLPETEGMIRGAHIAAMKDGATLINTARGAVIAEAEMAATLEARPDLTALLDVTFPEPPPPGSPLYRLPNVLLTPHIAGSVGTECRRMGRLIVDELGRWLRGEPLRHEVRPEASAHTSHRVAAAK
jgi:phosphoglycerate dehydrogenase-like enzyme